MTDTNAHDVAAYILEQSGGSMTAMKLQKLLYYSHAWHLVWEDKPLFPQPIQAWANGPVVRSIYDQHRGQFAVSGWPLGDSAKLTADERSTVDAVLEFYGTKTAHELSQMTHREMPWKLARRGVPDGARATVEIRDSDMFEYYDGLVSNS